MNNQDLDNVLKNRNADDCVKFFANMDEKQRKALSERALLWQRVNVGCNLNHPEMGWWKDQLNWAPKSIQKMYSQRDEARKLATQLPAEAKLEATREVTDIAVFATCGLTDIKKHDALPQPNAMRNLLAHRKPRWTNQFAKYALDKNPPLYWATIRQMEKDNEIELEHDSSYLAAMVLGLDRDDIVDVLLLDKQLIEEALRVLEDHSALNAMLSRPAQWTEGRFSWTGTVSQRWKSAYCKLVEDGLIPKDQVLKSVMSTLTRLALENSDGSASLRPSWFTEMHHELKLELDEHLEIYPEYCTALRSRSDWSVRWAIDRIKDLAGLPQFPQENACFALADVFLTKGKENSIKAIDCLKAIAEQHESLHSNVALCAAEGLSHSSPDIQKQVIRLIEKYGDKGNQELTERLAQQMEYVAVLNRERLAKWLPDSSQTDQDDSGAVSSSFPNVVSIATASGARNIATASTDITAPSVGVPKAPSQGSLEQQIAALKDSVQDIPETWLEIAGFQSGWNALEGKAIDLDSVDFEGTEIPRLDDDTKLQPIQDLDELVFLVARYAQSPTTVAVDDLELMMDGISRLCCERPNDFTQRVAPIYGVILNTFDVMKVMIEAWIDKKTNMARLFESVLPADVARSIGAFAHYGVSTAPIDRLLASRCIAAAHRISEGISLPLLAAPTHRGGWIDPVVLVERVKQGAHLPPNVKRQTQENATKDNAHDAQANQVPATLQQSMMDSIKLLTERIPAVFGGDQNNPFAAMVQAFQNSVVQKATEAASSANLQVPLSINGTVTEQSIALLRLAPDHRDEALQILDEANVASCEFLEATRYALGANDVKLGNTAPLWVAAARAREPFQDDLKVEEKFPGLGPDCGKAASYKLSLSKLKGHHYYGGFKVFDVEPECKPGQKSNIPTLMMHYHDTNSATIYYQYIAWSATMWPLCLEPFFAIGAEHTCNNWSTSDTSGGGKYLEPLYDPDIPAKFVALLLIVLGLTAKAKDENGAAIEALIQCIDDGRVNGRKLGDTLYQLYAAKSLRGDGNPIVTLSRWVKALRTVAQASQYHALVVAIAIERLLQGDPADAPKDLHAALELLLELLLQEQQVLCLDTAKHYLSGIKTTGKTGKLTKQLLALKPGTSTQQKRQEAILYALERRVDRIQRWQQRVEKASVPV